MVKVPRASDHKLRLIHGKRKIRREADACGYVVGDLQTAVLCRAEKEICRKFTNAYVDTSRHHGPTVKRYRSYLTANCHIETVKLQSQVHSGLLRPLLSDRTRTEEGWAEEGKEHCCALQQTIATFAVRASESAEKQRNDQE